MSAPPSNSTHDNNQASIISITTEEETRKHRHHVRWWVFWCLMFLILSPVVSVMLGLHLHARNFSYEDSTITKPGRTIIFEAVLIGADPQASMLTMDWTVLGESQSNCSADHLQSCSDINIFFDNNLLRSVNPGTIQTTDRPTQPIFRLNATTFAQQDLVANSPTFRTTLSLFSPGNRASNLLYYPFDQYSAEIFMLAQDALTNETIGIYINQTRGIATGFKTKADTRPNVSIPPGMIDIIVSLQRENLVKAYSIITTLAIWLITLILLLVMLTSVFFNFRQKGEVLVIPVATLFAFTQLRQSMPGAPPGFGDIVDFVGLLPCLALLSLSAALTLGAFIFSDPTDKPQQFGWGLLYEALPALDPRRRRQMA